jgi:hypothetical protein
VYKAKLARLETNPQFEGNYPLRNNGMEGIFSKFPETNLPFVLVGKPLTEGASSRVIRTSVIQSVEEVYDDDNTLRKIVFKTLNSTYELTEINAYNEAGLQ